MLWLDDEYEWNHNTHNTPVYYLLIFKTFPDSLEKTGIEVYHVAETHSQLHASKPEWISLLSGETFLSLWDIGERDTESLKSCIGIQYYSVLSLHLPNTSFVSLCNEKVEKINWSKHHQRGKWNRNLRTICGENTATANFLPNNVRIKIAVIVIGCEVSEYQWSKKKEIVNLNFLILGSNTNS